MGFILKKKNQGELKIQTITEFNQYEAFILSLRLNTWIFKSSDSLSSEIAFCLLDAVKSQIELNCPFSLFRRFSNDFSLWWLLTLLINSLCLPVAVWSSMPNLVWTHWRSWLFKNIYLLFVAKRFQTGEIISLRFKKRVDHQKYTETFP